MTRAVARIMEAVLLSAPDSEIREHQPEELRIKRVGADVAIAALRARLVVEVAGKVDSGTYCYTRVWARGEDGIWRVTGGHVGACPPTE